MITLKFVSQDATPGEVTIVCDQASIEPILEWYGAYHAGDRYEAFADGVKLVLDQNGYLVTQ